MHSLEHFLLSLTLVLGVAAITAVIFHRLKQPVVLGYLLAGLIIGPHLGFPLTIDNEIIHLLSELGVIFLMFFLGLDFCLRKLFEVIPTAGMIAIIECSFMLWLGYTVGSLLGFSSIECLFTGAIIAISSTTILLKILSEEETRLGENNLVFAILIVEDLIAIILMAVLSPLSHSSQISGLSIAQTTTTLVLFVLISIIIGMLIIPRLTRWILKLNINEVTLILSIALCFGLAVLAKHMGFSVALGAFLAGSLMSESGFDDELKEIIRPLRDLFAAIFFISIGMLIQPMWVLNNMSLILLFTILVIGGKFLGVSLGSFLSGHTLKKSVKTGLTLTQIGEFSFIMASIGLTSKAIGPSFSTLAISVSAITCLTTPYLIKLNENVSSWIDHRLPKPIQTFSCLYGSWIQKLKTNNFGSKSKIFRVSKLLLMDALIVTTIMIGLFISKHSILAPLHLLFPSQEPWDALIVLTLALTISAPFLIGIFRCSRSLGFEMAKTVLPRSPEGQVDLDLTARRMLVVTLQLMIILVVSLPVISLIQPFMPKYFTLVLVSILFVGLFISFWIRANQFYHHVTAGAELIVESLTQNSPSRYEVKMHQVNRLFKGFGNVTPYFIKSQSPVIGKTLAELNLRVKTGVSILAIARGKKGVIIPAGEEMIQDADVLALVGSTQAIEEAIQILD